MSNHLERLKHAGYKLTKARQTVLQVIENSGGHVTSTEVLDQVAAVAPAIGRASVFRTLDLLTRLSIIRPTYIGSSMTPSYVLLPNGHHHHIICTRCSRVMEFEECGLEAMTTRLETEFGVKMTGHMLEFYGLCAFCQQQPIEADEDA
jgi:Fur family transcriptional regulator, ferric uptake regulator